MRAAIVDDSAEDRLNLRALLGRCRGIEVVGEAPTLQRDRELLAKTAVDLLFLDIQLGHENGLSRCNLSAAARAWASATARWKSRSAAPDASGWRKLLPQKFRSLRLPDGCFAPKMAALLRLRAIPVA